MSLAARSFSRIPFRLLIANRGEVKGELIKHLAPFTNSRLIKLRRLEGVITREKSQVVFLANMSVGLEKSKKDFEAGDIAILPIDGSIRFILEKITASRPMNHIGAVKNGLDILLQTKSGDSATFIVEEDHARV